MDSFPFLSFDFLSPSSPTLSRLCVAFRFSVWSFETLCRLRAFDNMNNTVTDVKFHPSGSNLLAYAVSYDWHKVHFRRLESPAFSLFP